MSNARPLQDVLKLEALGDGRFQGLPDSQSSAAVVFGGQLLAQSILAAQSVAPDKYVKTIHIVFVRGGDVTKPLEIDVIPLATGKTMASAEVGITQDGKLRTKALVSLTAEEPDLIRHGLSMPEVTGVQETPSRPSEAGYWEIRVVDDVDFVTTDVGPAELAAWIRFPDAPSDGATGQALIAYATDGFLIGTAMRPHEGIGQSMAHVSISTSVLSHTLTFHEPIDATQWHLLAHESPYAGRGRSYGRANIFTEDGRLVASFVQDNMIRDFPKDRAPAAGERSKF